MKVESSWIVSFGWIVVAASRVSASHSSSSFARLLQQTNATTTTTNSSNNPIFGTRNGYDQGGTEPLCWKTTWPTTQRTNHSVAQNRSNLIEQSNAEMYALSQQSELLPECYSDTKLTVLSYTMGNSSSNSDKPQLFLGEPYTIQMELQMDFANLPMDGMTVTNGTTTNGTTISTPLFPDMREVYFRLHLCDAIQQGFCNPIRDTRAADASLTREQADQPLAAGHSDANASLPFPENPDKWFYDPNVTLNGLTLDDDSSSSLYYYGRWCKWNLRRQNETTMYRTLIPVTIEFPLPPNDANNDYRGARPFFFVGQAVVPLGVNTLGQQVRLDIAQTVPSKVVYVSPPPTIATVGSTTTITLAVVIGLAGSFALGCFLAIVRYRQHAIMRLAQGPFLAIMAAACCLQIVFSFSHLPLYDVFCRLRGPFVQLPISLVGAVLVGRVWRIYGTLSAVHKVGKASNNNDSTNKKPFLDTYFVGCLDGLARVPFSLVSCCGSKNNSKTSGARRSIRSAVTANETWCLIAMLMLPQVVLQIYSATMDDHAQLVTELNELGNEGRIVCANGDTWVALTGTAFSCLLYLLAVIMAWLSRDLPFCFNEKDQIFHAATICAIITAMSIAVAQVIDDPSTSPSAVVLLQSIVSIGIALTVLVIMVWPKIHRAWKGQPVVMSHVLGSSFSKSSETTNNTSMTQIHQHSSSPPTSPKPLSSLDATQDEEQNAVMDHADKTTWNEHEALPSHIESQILELQRTFRSVADKWYVCVCCAIRYDR